MGAHVVKTGWVRGIGWTLVAVLIALWAVSSWPAAAQDDGANRRADTTAASQREPPREQSAGGGSTDAGPSGTTGTTQPTGTQWQPTDLGVARDQEPEAKPARPGTARPESPAAEAGAAPTASTAGPKDPRTYELWVLVPALVTILLAILLRQVVPAMVIGVLVGAYMMVPCLGADDPYARLNTVVAGFRLAVERYVVGAIIDPGHDYGHVKIIVFTLLIGFMVGVIGKNGGTEGLVRLVAGETNSPRRAGLTAWLAGLVVFFDDYANTMTIGPAMRSVFDRVKFSRAKLAYIVDSTAAPVATIAIIGTWIAVEIGFIQDGLDAVTRGGTPEFLIDSQGKVLGGMQAFLQSIPYRFYPILMIFLVFLTVLTGRDFGPMKRSERKVLSRIERDPVAAELGAEQPKKASARWWLGLLPVVVLIGTTVAVLVLTGLHSPEVVALMNQTRAAGQNVWAQESWLAKASHVLRHSDAYLAIYHGAVCCVLVAVVLTLLTRACSMRDTIEAGLDGMARMFPAMVILVLAWVLSAVLQDLKLGDVVTGRLEAQSFPAAWLPFATFLTAAVISFATGTLWGTMTILCPITVQIGARLLAGVEQGEALTLFYASVGSVLAGAVFGGHCSPISDTTVLSSIASGCRHEEHVWTQMPYAFLAAIAAMGLGNVMCGVYKQPWYYGLGTGAIFLLLFVLMIGRRPVASFDLAEA